MYFSLINKINQVVLYVVGALLFAMCAFAILQVVARLGFTSIGISLSVPWSEEIGRFLMIWMIFLGTAYAFSSRQMVALRLLVDNLPSKWRLAAEAAALAVVLGFAVLLWNVGLKATEFGWIEKSPVLGLDKAYVYLAMPVSAALIGLNACSVFARELIERNRKRHAAATNIDPQMTSRGGKGS